MSENWNWAHVGRRISTVLSVVAAGAQAAGVFFIAAPPEWKDGFPAVFGFVLLGVGMAATALVPVATSFKQKGLEK